MGSSAFSERVCSGLGGGGGGGGEGSGCGCCNSDITTGRNGNKKGLLLDLQAPVSIPAVAMALDSPTDSAVSEIYASSSTALSSPQDVPLRTFKCDQDSLDISDNVIGRGSFCSVRQAVDRATNKVYALKSATRANQSSIVIHEAKIMTEMVNPPEHGVAQFHGAILEPPGIVLTYYPRTLKSLIQAGPITFDGLYVGEKRWIRWSIQLANGLAYLQSKNIVHCDIKSDNVFLDENFNAYIGDFSSAKICGSDQDQDQHGPQNTNYKCDSCRGHENDQGHGYGDESANDSMAAGAFSVQFSAPELLSEPTATPSFHTDDFSLGLVLLHAATGSEPYHQASKSIAQKLMWAQKGTPLLYCSDEDIARMSSVQHLLQVFITKRSPVAEILPQLHAFSAQRGYSAC